MKEDVLSFLENEAVFYFKVKAGNCGETDMERIIWLNPGEDILPTAVHEAIHCLRNDWSETQVIAMEHNICSTLTIREWHRIFRAISNNLKGGK